MAIATNGSPPMALAYHRLLNPSASASAACSIIRSTVAAPPLNPMRMSRQAIAHVSGDPFRDRARTPRPGHGRVVGGADLSGVGRAFQPAGPLAAGGGPASGRPHRPVHGEPPAL